MLEFFGCTGVFSAESERYRVRRLAVLFFRVGKRWKGKNKRERMIENEGEGEWKNGVDKDFCGEFPVIRQGKTTAAALLGKEVLYEKIE